MTNVARWGILGPGRIAPRIARSLVDNPRGRLGAIASRDPERARDFAARFRPEAVHETYDALLADPDVDVVYIALPNGLHAEWTIRALRAGKHVLCEKPLALTVEDVDAIAEAADRADRIAVEATMALHHPQTNLALEMARNGALGDVQLVSAAFSFVLTYPNDPRVDPTLGGGSLWDVGCYCVNIARRVAGEEPEALDGFARFDERDVDRAFTGILRFPSGMLAHFESGFAAARERVELVGSDATLVLASPFLPSPDGPPASVVLVRDGERTEIPVADVDQYRLEVDDLHAAMAGEQAPHVDLAFSRGSISSLVALDRAARQSGGVRELVPRPV